MKPKKEESKSIGNLNKAQVEKFLDKPVIKKKVRFDEAAKQDDEIGAQEEDETAAVDDTDQNCSVDADVTGEQTPIKNSNNESGEDIANENKDDDSYGSYGDEDEEGSEFDDPFEQDDPDSISRSI